ncbi:NAD(P)H-dependent oxidoreductase [Sphingomonas montana]|uniref:NAD(P)H-dependent oxidoreductase n=1 Tax=Sphingomonas montana TaxID=1843236 RepID=UPI00096E4DF6|nr:NAD(P)H-dependent oxidoreductase [Sphingomonas montana]
MTLQATVEARNGQHAVILCHPDPGSFDHAIANTYRDAVLAAGQTVVFRDLYALGFDPVLRKTERAALGNWALSRDVAVELGALAGSDVFVLIYPIWFGSAPAMMKGYVERVLGAGMVPEGVLHPEFGVLLANRRLLSFTTSAMTNVWLAREGQERGLDSVFDNYIVRAFGMLSNEHKRFGQIAADLDKRSADVHLREVSRQAQRTCAQIAFGEAAMMRDPTLARQFSR